MVKSALLRGGCAVNIEERERRYTRDALAPADDARH